MGHRLSERSVSTIVRVIGALTALGAAQFFAPALVLGATHMAVADDAGLFFARHWALLVGCLGGLMVYSAGRPALRAPVVFVVALEKAGLVLLVATDAANPALAGMHAAAVFDGVCVLLLTAVLLGQRRRAANDD